MFKHCKSCLVIGISGATCSGKTTLANAINRVISNSIVLNQDKYYWAENSSKHTLAKELNHINWELVSAFDNEMLIMSIESNLTKTPDKYLPNTENDTILRKFDMMTKEYNTIPKKDALFGDVVQNDVNIKQLQALFEHLPKVVIVDGILIFNHPEILNMCDLKVFVTLDYKTCLDRRKTRSYDPTDGAGYFEKVVYPSYINNLEEMKRLDGDNSIKYLNGGSDMLMNFKIIIKQIVNNIDTIIDK